MRRADTRSTPSHELHKIALIADSIGFNATKGVQCDEQYIHQAALQLRTRGCFVTALNFAISGNTTTQMAARAQCLFEFGVPDLAIIAGGVNDPGGGISGAQTTLNIRSILKLMREGAAGIVATEAALPALTPIGTRYIVQADGSATGGVSPGVAGAGAGAVTIWTPRNPLAGESGWGRIAARDAGEEVIKRRLVGTTQFLNYGSTDTPLAQNVSYAAVRAAQAAAQAAETGAVLWDLWQYQADLITAGIVAQNDYTAFHAGATDQHPNNKGAYFMANSLVACILAQPSLSGKPGRTWADDLKAAV